MDTAEKRAIAVKIIKHHLDPKSVYMYKLENCTYTDAVGIKNMVDRRVEKYGLVDVQCDLIFKDGVAHFDIC